MTTTSCHLDDLLPIALDMTASLTAADRSRRLVDAVLRALPCDAVALLRLEDQQLAPVAARGFGADLPGRRFALAEHPRLQRICSSSGPVVFPADCELPDPYDGMIGAAPHLDVHSCLGCPLRVEGELVGVLTADALRPGAFDGLDPRFLTHLAALAAAALRTSDLIEALERRAHHRGLVVQDLVREELGQRGGWMIGESAAMQALRREIEIFARAELPVLVTGETGVGKELVVRMLHALSPRREQPLVYLNCAALPESMVEAELFGYEKGAFTGAVEPRLGKLRVADGASLLLDEIGELPLSIQPKFLRALQAGEVQPLGCDRALRVDVRLFAATNRDLEAEVAAGRFRADLLHRLDVCRLRVPPLRERAEDIPLLAGHFADGARRSLGVGPIRFAPGVPELLQRGEWRGNVRELENAIHRAVLRAAARVEPGERILVEARDLELAATSAPLETMHAAATAPAEAEALPLREAVQQYQRDRIREALARSEGNWSAAARALGMHRSNLHHLARRLGLLEPAG
ncbi:MAG: nitric oxide reductase transcriptional regulator NorR [Planctomycetes bacterium]|nr:nitric oxide reductase transcriptional regulator NorR [Planctomycetota bacterium]